MVFSSAGSWTWGWVPGVTVGRDGRPGNVGRRPCDAGRRPHATVVVGSRSMGPHYARTPHEWRGQFSNAVGAVSELGVGLVFPRKQDLYLAYVEGGFRAAYPTVRQLVLERSAP